MIRQLNECFWRAATGGAGNLVVASAMTGFYTPGQCSAPAVVDGGLYTYRAESDDGSQHQSGLAPYDVASTSLLLGDPRARIFQSSNAGNQVTFSAAPKVRLGAAAQAFTITAAKYLYFSDDADAVTEFDASGDYYLEHAVVRSGFTTSLLFTNCISLKSIALSAPAATSIDLAGCRALKSFNTAIGSLASVTSLNFGDCAAIEKIDLGTAAISLASLSVGGLAVLETVSVSFGFSLTSLDVAGCTSLIELVADNCALSSAAVDTVLVDLDTNGASNGTVALNANAAPGPAGLAAKASLEGRGWTVTVDP